MQVIIISYLTYKLFPCDVSLSCLGYNMLYNIFLINYVISRELRN